MLTAKNNDETSTLVAQLLLDLGAVQISPHRPFTYASGLRGPIYCDNRQIWSEVNCRDKIIKIFLERINSLHLNYDLLAGLATAGIPHGAILADHLKKPFIYIRSKAKDHGKQNQIEGKYSPGQKIILVEDLVNQGKSLGEAILAAQKAGLIVVAALCIVDYQMEDVQKLLSEIKIPLHSLTHFTSLVATACSLKLVDEEGRDMLLKWQKSPKTWAP